MSRDLFSEEVIQGRSGDELAHWHEGIELLYIKEGTLCCLLQGKEFKLTQGTVCIINQKSVHRICSNGEETCIFQRLMIDPELFTADRRVWRKYIEPVLTDERFSHIIAPTKQTAVREIVNLINSIGDLERLRPEAYELPVIASLHMIFQKLFLLYQEAIGVTAAVINTDAVLFRKMADFVYANYAGKLSLEEIAANGNISRSKCCALFRKYAQHSPVDFLNLYRLEVSRELLKNTADSISNIAFACGFGQASYYNRLFLREYDETPTAYRKRMV